VRDERNGIKGMNGIQLEGRVEEEEGDGEMGEKGEKGEREEKLDGRWRDAEKWRWKRRVDLWRCGEGEVVD